MATTTLDAMAAGGIYDHLVGGFCRYSTDREWLVPHFEKMLTDQALLARTYLHAWQVTGEERYLTVATETLDYVTERLGAPGGGLYSSEDADAGGVEGSHATFTLAQVHEALGVAGRPDLVDAVVDWYGISERGNWEGTNVLRRPVGAPLARPPAVEEGRRLLLEARRAAPTRARRQDPDRVERHDGDDPGRGGRGRREPRLGRASGAHRGLPLRRHAPARRPVAPLVAGGQGAASGLRGRPRVARDELHPAGDADRQGALDRAGDDGRRRPPRTVLGRPVTRLATVARRRTDQDATGGVFTTAHDAERLVVRPKDLVDGAVPSANSVAADALLRLAALTGRERYRSAGERILSLSAPLLAEHPGAVADLVAASALVASGSRGRRRRRPTRPGRDSPHAVAPDRRRRMGRAHGFPTLGGPGGASGLRLPWLHLPHPHRRCRYPVAADRART